MEKINRRTSNQQTPCESCAIWSTTSVAHGLALAIELDGMPSVDSAALTSVDL